MIRAPDACAEVFGQSQLPTVGRVGVVKVFPEDVLLHSRELLAVEQLIEGFAPPHRRSRMRFHGAIRTRHLIARSAARGLREAGGLGKCTGTCAVTIVLPVG